MKRKLRILNHELFSNRNFYQKYILYALMFSIFMSTVMNIAFYKYIIVNKISIGTAIACFFVLFFNYLAIFFTLSFRYIGKYVIFILTYLAFVSEYYMLSSNTPIGYATMKSVLETHLSEALELIDLKLIFFALMLVVIMIPFFYKVKLHCISWYKDLLFRLCCALLSLFVGLTIIYTNYIKLSAFTRKNDDIMCFININNFTFETFRVVKNMFQKPKILNILDEKPIRKKTKKNHFVVLLIGETSRKDSFSLNGYKRKTNPKLEKQDIINFSKATSCGTYTAYSVPCMFSFKTRKTYRDFEFDENVLDILVKTGVKVSWYENDDSCAKGQADNEKIEYINLAYNQKYIKNSLCKNRRCFDEILINILNDEAKKFINQISKNNNKEQKDKVVVLHMIGSHGPLYYKRYPRKWAKFKPECTNSNPSLCSIQELKNAYDNTILYQDFVLSEIIDILRSMSKKQKQLDITMMYVSDHGESLGEKGLFLHAFPYKIAPKEQIEIPFIIWTNNNNMKNKFNLKKNNKVSHDNISHTLLGLFNVESKVKDNSLDLTK